MKSVKARTGEAFANSLDFLKLSQGKWQRRQWPQIGPMPWSESSFRIFSRCGRVIRIPKESIKRALPQGDSILERNEPRKLGGAHTYSGDSSFAFSSTMWSVTVALHLSFDRASSALLWLFELSCLNLEIRINLSARYEICSFQIFRENPHSLWSPY